MRLDGGRVVLDVDLDVGTGTGTVESFDARVQVSPARALELLDGLIAVQSELQAASRAQRQTSALRWAVELVTTQPLLAGWSSISENNYDRERGGDYVQVLYFKPENLERYAEQAGCEVVRTHHSNADWLDVWVGSAEQGWIALHCQYAYYPDGRPEPTAEDQPDALSAAIEEVAAVAAEDDTAALAAEMTPGREAVWCEAHGGLANPHVESHDCVNPHFTGPELRARILGQSGGAL